MYETSFGLDVDDLQRDHFTDPQATGVHGGQDGIVVEAIMCVSDVHEYVSDLRDAQDNRQGLVLLGLLGDEALDLEGQAIRRRQSGEQLPSMRMGDFFFSDDEDLNPDSDEE